MHFILLCILSSTGIFIVFKTLDSLRIASFPVIVINYLVATILGFMVNRGHFNISSIGEMDWLPLSMIIGILFIVMFFVVAYSSEKAGISVTTVASKMSVIFPILFSLAIDPADNLTVIKSAAIVCTLSGVALTVFKPLKTRMDRTAVAVPLILFVGMGLVDSLVKYAQHGFVSDSHTAFFSAILFLNAFIAGVIILFFSPKHFPGFLNPSTWGWGVLLGGANFGSIFFLVRALNFGTPDGSSIDSSVIFGVNNTGIVGLSVLAGSLIFKEQLRPMNWFGILLSALALLLFAFG